MKKIFLLLPVLFLFVPGLVMAGPGCVPVSCNESTGNDRLNADTIDISRQDRKQASRCYICEDGYCEDGDVVYNKTFTKFVVCKQSWGWIGDDKWQEFTPQYCTDKLDLSSAATPESGLQKMWLIEGVSYEDGQVSALGGKSYASGNNICYYYDCPDGSYLDSSSKKCVFQQLETPATTVAATAPKPTITPTVPTSPVTSSKPTPAITDSPNENNKNVKFSCPESDLQNIYMWQSQYATNPEIYSLISNILTYCFETNDIEEYQFRTYMDRLKVLIEVQQNLADEAQKASELAKQQQLLQQQNAAKERIASIVNNLDKKAANFKRSDWKNEDGKFNTSRLISDSVAGVVLGTAGGLITSSVVKKSQVKSGFEDLNCAIGGQVVAGWGDEFLVGIQ